MSFRSLKVAFPIKKEPHSVRHINGYAFNCVPACMGGQDLNGAFTRVLN